MRHWKIWTRNRRRSFNNRNNSDNKVHAVAKSRINAMNNKWSSRRMTTLINDPIDNGVRYLLLRAIASLVSQSL